MNFDRPGFDREVGLRLQLIRKRRGQTQAVLAEKIGLPRASYANIEAGRQRVPVDIVWRAAVVLGVPISALVPEPVNKSQAADSLFPMPEAVSVPLVASASGAGGDGWPVLTYVGSSAYPTLSPSFATAAPVMASTTVATTRKRPHVRAVGGSKSTDE